MLLGHVSQLAHLVKLKFGHVEWCMDGGRSRWHALGDGSVQDGGVV
jgi:hypothetical protein